MIDLDAYFGRIGYAGPRTPELATLRAIHALHPAAIPFENLDPLLGRPVPLDLDTLQRKLVGSRRGGYCFEQNTLFKAMLEALGFPVTSFAARVLWKAPPDRPPNPRAHMVLKVDIEEDAWLADVGFGGYLFAAPLRFAPDVEQPTAFGTFRLQRSDFICTLQLKLASDWQDVYRFTVEPQFPIDQEVANWFTATHPNSRFRNNLLIERLTPQARVSLFNTRLTHRHADGKVEEIVLTTPGELVHALAADFQLESPADPTALFVRLPPPSVP